MRFLVLGAALALALTGCGIELPTVSGSPSDSGSPSPEITPPVVTPPAITGSDIGGAACDDLVQPPVLDQLTTGFAAMQNYEPPSDSTAALLQSIGGIACAWGRADQQIVVAFAKPSADSTTALETYYSAISTPTDSFGAAPDVRGFFSVANGLGDGEAFLGGYWVSVQSAAFTKASDAEGFVASANQIIPQA